MYNSIISGFSEYVETGAEALYQTLCSEITAEFSECSKQVWIFSEYLHNVVKQSMLKIEPLMKMQWQVREMESRFLNPEVGRADLAQLLSDIQTQEKQKLHLVSFPFTQI